MDLKKTVVASLRSELRGVNTYRWEAWYDAAKWCYDNKVNLDEAYDWIIRSIEGGYGGFGADKNVTNLLLKAKIERWLGLQNEYLKTTEELMSFDYSAYDANYIVQHYLKAGENKTALSFAIEAEKKYSDTWFLKLNLGVAYYKNDEPKKGKKLIELSRELAPDNYAIMIDNLHNDIKNGTY